MEAVSVKCFVVYIAVRFALEAHSAIEAPELHMPVEYSTNGSASLFQVMNEARSSDYANWSLSGNPSAIH